MAQLATRTAARRSINARIRWAAMLPFATYAAILLAVYSSTLVTSYGFEDDYNQLAASLLHYHTSDLFIMMAKGGRPLQILVLLATFGPVSSVSDLRYVRLIGILGCALIAWLLARALAHAGLDRSLAYIVGLLVALLPVYQLYAAWATTSFIPYVAALAAAAAFAAERAYHKLSMMPVDRRSILQAGAWWAVAALLFAAAMMSYQPAALAFWLFAAIPLLVVRDTPPRAILARLALWMPLMLVAMFCDWLVVRILTTLSLGGDNSALPRTALVVDIPGKILWFLQQPLTYAFTQVQVNPQPGVAVAVCLFTVVGLIFYWPGALGVRLLKLIVAAGLLPLAYAANLLVAESWMAVRTLTALSPLVTIYVALALVGYIDALRAVWVFADASSVIFTGARTAILALAIAVFAVLAARNVTLFVALPSQGEYATMRQQLRAQIALRRPGPTDTLYVITCYRPSWMGPVVREDEYGSPNCIVGFAMYPMMRLALHEVQPDDPMLHPITVLPGDIQHVPEGAVVVDLRGVSEHMLPHRLLPLTQQ